ncbi:caspase-1-like isoform X2 [Bacillus rossius redtenbacheri]|uniref:caspase-1-like isoform X2 n=1 Tax=Bacillus rossius redtenbacheri TaxID=93214 RepID=UPI002FDD5C79
MSLLYMNQFTEEISLNGGRGKGPPEEAVASLGEPVSVMARKGVEQGPTEAMSGGDATELQEVEVEETQDAVVFVKPRQRRASDVIDSLGSRQPDSPRSRNSSVSSPRGRDAPWSQDSVFGTTPPSGPSTLNAVRKTSPRWSDTSSESSISPESDVGYGSKNSLLMTSSVEVFTPDWLKKKLTPAGRRQPDEADANPYETEEYDKNLAEDEVKEVVMSVHRHSLEYNMDHKHRGKAVIFNHDQFEEANHERPGSKVDVQNLSAVYSSLGFEVVVHHNLELGKLRSTLQSLAKEDHSEADCLWVTVLTHGHQGGLIKAYDAYYPAEILWLPFTPDRCESLGGKPKIFVIQACRGDRLDTGVRMVARSTTQTDSSVQSYKLPLYADFLIAYSSVDGFYSFRNPEEGTWYVQCLCSELAESATTVDLLKIFTMVARRVAVEYETFNDEKPWMSEKKQIPSTVSMLIRDVYFRPKGGRSAAD